MREIRTSGSMSGDGKRSVAAWPKLPRPSSTLPKLKCSCPTLRPLSDQLQTQASALSQGQAITHQAYSAFSILTPFVVINAIAVANIEAALTAILPDRVLDESGKGLRELEGLQPKYLPVYDHTRPNISLPCWPPARRLIVRH
jgi:hypothetical protein